MSWFRKTIPPKPENLVQYRFGFSCKNGHCQTPYMTNAHLTEISGFEQVCRTCGEKSFPSVIKETTGHCWLDVSFSPSYWGREASTYEFVRFLDEDTGRLPEEVVTRLRDFAARTFDEVDADPEISYKNGLHDGASMAAQYVLGELKEETNA